jgi:hypothetical protein
MAVFCSKVYLFGGGLAMRFTMIHGVRKSLLPINQGHKKSDTHVSLLRLVMGLSSLRLPFPCRHHCFRGREQVVEQAPLQQLRAWELAQVLA